MADAFAILTLMVAALMPIIPFLPRRWLERVFGLGSSVPRGVSETSDAAQPQGDGGMKA